MAGDGLFVSSDGLEAGASRCHDAAASASAGADLLRSVSVDGGIFGDFDAAHDFHGVACESHDHQVRTFTAHTDQLSELSAKGRDAATLFTAADHQSETSLDRQVRLGGDRPEE